MSKVSEKAEYCLNCKNKPCSQKGCPLNNDIPAFISEIKKDNYKEAYKILSETTVMPAICGRICPHYKQCMGACVRGIKGEPVKIGELEALVGDLALKEKMNIDFLKNEIAKPKNIAIIGGGPSGITAAVFLARSAYNVTIYEKNMYLGGLLIHGIPEFRLPKEIVKKTIDSVMLENINVKYGFKLENKKQIEKLENEYDNIILAVGANKSSKLGIDGEDLAGVYGGNELLEYNLCSDYNGKIVLVNGGGNVAMDVARSIKRLGAKKVIVVYRREREQMPAETKEIDDAISEGIEFLFKHNIIKIMGHKYVEKVELIKTELIQKNGEDRLSPINIEKSNYQIKADYVIRAIGSETEEYVRKLGLETDERGRIKTNEIGQTSNSKIYAIGDLAGNISTVAWACRSGRDVANNLMQNE